ncbi:hypothetical protein E2E32_14410 [Klebsiella pneumoniae subsp. pneumoniae]|nr:hypothetical protein DNK70_14450 [Klebsiella pneumoniae]QBI86198.1 hypothetical protein CEA76_11195 [Klebsiella pneumoniae]QHG05263.1 hypothetical protein E2E32_14410 [Klebsiella pneumoniae subsp. pneumoniae]
MMSLWDALRMNMMISYQELVRTFLSIMTLFCRTNALKKNRGVKNCKVFELNVALCYKSTCV